MIFQCWVFLPAGKFANPWSNLDVQVLLKPQMDQGKVTDSGESIVEKVQNTVSGVVKGALGSTL
jgi:hypothetical protein